MFIRKQISLSERIEFFESMNEQSKKIFLEGVLLELEEIKRDNSIGSNKDAVRKIGGCLAKITILNAISLNNPEQGQANIELIKNNIKIIDKLMELISKKNIHMKDLLVLDSITGSSTFDHFVRTTVMFILFADHFNNYIGQNNGGSWLRKEYNITYIKFYKKLIPDIRDTLEYVFKDGIRQLDKLLIRNCAVGVLLHDLAKYPELQYHDGPEEYDKKKVRTHALQSYVTLSKYLSKLQIEDIFFSTEDVALMAALHHDYYDYNLKTTEKLPSAAMLLQAKIDPTKDRRDIRYVMSFDSKDFFKNNRERALAFLPAKMLEIVDVYDALTDKSKKRRKPYDYLKAVEVMKKEFLDDNQKIDPILFNIFVDFLQKQFINVELPKYS